MMKGQTTPAKTLFVLVVPMGAPQHFVWLATTTQAGYDDWACKGKVIVLNDVRGFILTPNQSTGRISAMIGAPYLGDTSQENVACFPSAVEIISEVEFDDAGNPSCKDKPSLFINYVDSVDKWRAARSNIATPPKLIITPGEAKR